MPEDLYLQGDDGSLESLEPMPFRNEDELQSLIVRFPILLGGEQMQPDAPRRWLLVGREMGLPEVAIVGDRWSVDLLFVDQDGIPTLVEVKRGDNPEMRRKVVGQILEYAAHAPWTWPVERLRDELEATAGQVGQEPLEALSALLQLGGEPEADGFWERVGLNLDAQRLRLLFVADNIPDSLRCVAEFLDRHMARIEVFAVEVKQYRNNAGKVYSTRVHGGGGGSPTAVTRRPALNRESFLEAFDEPGLRRAAARLLDAGTGSATLYWGTSGVSIRVLCPRLEAPFTIGWLYPPRTTNFRYKTRDFTFGEEIIHYHPNLDQEVKNILEEWVNLFAEDPFTVDASSKGVAAWSVPYADVVQYIDLLEGRLSEVLVKLHSLE